MTQHFSSQHVARAFSQAASRYDAAAVLQKAVGLNLIDRLQWMRLAPQRILDLGSGTGAMTQVLQKHYPKADIISLDLAEGMLMYAKQQASWWSRQRLVCADALQLPFPDDSMDFIFSNLMLQWTSDLPAVFREWRRVLRPGGLLLFSTLCEGTLSELQSSWATVDDGVHVHRYWDMHDLGDQLLQSQWQDPVLDRERVVLHYATVYQLMRDLKNIGANNAAPDRIKSLTGKQRMQRCVSAYERFRSPEGVLPASYEVVYGQAWAPLPVSQEIVILPSAIKRQYRS